MKDCENCEYFCGWYEDDGTPGCEFPEGYEACPFNDQTNVKPAEGENTGAKIELDMEIFRQYFQHTVQNTIEKIAQDLIANELKDIIRTQCKSLVENLTEKALKETIFRQVETFMAGDITIGGGWRSELRTLPRQEYMAECIQKQLGKIDLQDTAIASAKKEIEKFSRSLRDEINRQVKICFDEATRQVLTENVVSMLMNNDTYQRLSKSMQTFLPEGK